MENETDDLEKLLSDVRKTISDNKQFLTKLDDETDEDGFETVPVEEEYEEL